MGHPRQLPGVSAQAWLRVICMDPNTLCCGIDGRFDASVSRKPTTSIIIDKGVERDPVRASLCLLQTDSHSWLFCTGAAVAVSRV